MIRTTTLVNSVLFTLIASFYADQSKEYGTIYRNTISQKIVEEFGAVRKRKNDGTILIFDQEKLKQFQTSYDENAAFKVEARKDISGDESEGSESSEGSNECGCAAIQVYQNGKIEVFRYIPIDNNICNVQNKVESEIAPITADVDDAKGSLLADKKNSLQGLLLSCAFCDSYKADDAVDMELHVLRKHKQELELLSMGKDVFSKEKNSMIKTS